MTAVPEGTTAAPSRDHLRAAHADRERAIDALKAAFVQGRLAKDEFDARIGQAFASRTYADLAAVTADIRVGPAGPAAVPPSRRPARTLTRAEKAAAWCLYSVMTVIFTIAIVPGPTSVGVIVLTAAVIYSVFWLLGGLTVIAARHGWHHASLAQQASNGTRPGRDHDDGPGYFRSR